MTLAANVIDTIFLSLIIADIKHTKWLKITLTNLKLFYAWHKRYIPILVYVATPKNVFCKQNPGPWKYVYRGVDLKHAVLIICAEVNLRTTPYWIAYWQLDSYEQTFFSGL